MSKPGEGIELIDFDADDDEYIDDDDEYESTVGDTTGAVGGTPAETDFGGRQIQTPADQLRHRGSVELGENDINKDTVEDLTRRFEELRKGSRYDTDRVELTESFKESELGENDINKDTVEDLTRRFEELRKGSRYDADRVELTESFKESELLDINRKLSTQWEKYVEKTLGNKFEIAYGGTYKHGTEWSITDKGIFVEYPKGRKTRLTATGNPRKFLKPSTISKNYGTGGTSFVRDILGVVDYSSASKKTQQLAKKTSWSLRDVPKVGETPTGRPDRESVRKKLDIPPELDDFSNVLPNDTIADNEEINTFLTEKGQLKRLSDVYEHLVKRRNEKEKELKNLKSKGDRTVTYKGEEGEGEALLPVSEEDAERARELEAEIKEFDIAITNQYAKVSNSIQRLRLSLENFIDSEDTLGSRVSKLFRQEGVTIASLLTAIGMTIAAVVEGIVLATKSAVSAVTPAPKPKPPGPKPPGPKPDVPDTPIEPPKPPEPPKPKTWTDWLKDQLQKIANLLLKLGDKALIALPGIIGAAVNFVLKSAGAVVGFLADHL